MVERDRPKMTVRRMPIACWLPKVTNTHSECVKLIFFHVSNDYANVPQCHVIRTSPVLLYYTVHIESTRELACSENSSSSASVDGLTVVTLMIPYFRIAAAYSFKSR